MEIKGRDIQKDQVKDIQHQREVCPAVWFRDMAGNQRNLQKTAVLCQQMPEVHHGHPLSRGHKERRTQISRRKWGWIGHTLRKPTSNITDQACTEMEPTG